jgi:hypothetical protein
MEAEERLFVDERNGRLMRLEENEVSRYQYEIWFEYTRAAMEQVREGAMVAVPNFGSRGEDRRLSILEITGLRPVHYALGDSPDGYPGFVMEAARNAAQDWTIQEDRSDEDATIIRCTAIPTNLELRIGLQQDPQLAAESNIPMIGAEARLLATAMVQRVVNRDIDQSEMDVAVAGRLVRDRDVQVLVRVEDLIKLHFAIFGFTGAGKSNLLSTIVADVFSTIGNGKVVLFDLMGEYGTLLLDRLNDIEDARIVAVGARSLPQAVIDYISVDPQRRVEADLVRRAASQLARYFVVPRSLGDQRDPLARAFLGLLEQEKVKILSEFEDAVVRDVFGGIDGRCAIVGRAVGHINRFRQS